MKTTILILFFSLFSLTIKATECVDKTFKEEHLNIYLCQNYSNYNETRTLMYKARAKILNDYIGEQIKLGQLQNKKIEIQLYDPVLTHNHLNISKGKNGYFVTYSGFATIQQLKIFVDYFADQNWKPFFTSDYQKVSSETISKQINNFFLDNKTSEIPLTRLNVWTLDNLKLDYLNDKLKYFVNSIELDIAATSSLPIKINDRFLLFQSDSIFVLQGQEIIERHKIENPITEDYDIYVYDKWVNICNGGIDNWIYSYSYDKNKFHKRKDVK
ncbi:hypothetical protein PG637_10875 [Riemerella anatipestifer]|nr:hypothetical protein [Riemerella anatipestifer]MDY3326166.1 hypothetical protein [Riemerella anatipestifer]MDY3354516.1 hypothetical protein [Riemerella anatipestifer]